MAASLRLLLILFPLATSVSAALVLRPFPNRRPSPTPTHPIPSLNPPNYHTPTGPFVSRIPYTRPNPSIHPPRSQIPSLFPPVHHTPMNHYASSTPNTASNRPNFNKPPKSTDHDARSRPNAAPNHPNSNKPPKSTDHDATSRPNTPPNRPNSNKPPKSGDHDIPLRPKTPPNRPNSNKPPKSGDHDIPSKHDATPPTPSPNNPAPNSNPAPNHSNPPPNSNPSAGMPPSGDNNPAPPNRYAPPTPSPYVCTNPIVRSAHTIIRKSATHYMKGSPQQGALVLQITVGSGGGILRGVLDITSELVWVQCGHCRTCLRLTPRGTHTFLPDVSPSFARVGCGSKLCERVVNGHQPNCDATAKSACMYQELFFGGDQYTSGFLATESFTFGATTTAGVVFGCSANITVLGLAAGASGFLGFNRGPFSLTSQLNISGFSYFISHKDSSKSFFSFWADPACAVSVHQQPGKHTRYTPLLQPTANQNPYLYYVNLIGVKVDGQLLTAIPAGTFDVRVKDGSGGVYLSTTVPVTYLEEAAYSVLRQELVTRIQSQGVAPVSVDDDPLCYMTRSYKNIKVPRLALVFDGADATMNLYTKNYFLPVDGGQTCFTILPSNGGSVLGSLLQAGRTITYNDINGDGGSLSFD